MDIEELQSLTRRKISISFSLPFSLVQAIDEIAAHDGISVTALVTRAIRRGLQVERDERATKATTGQS